MPSELRKILDNTARGRWAFGTVRGSPADLCAGCKAPSVPATVHTSYVIPWSSKALKNWLSLREASRLCLSPSSRKTSPQSRMRGVLYKSKTVARK